MTQEDRANLARQQEDALRAILAKGALPIGMSAAQVHHTSDVLQAKRRREALLAAPDLAAALQDTFAKSFDYFARQVPYPARGGPVADAANFGDHLARQGLLPEDAAYERMMLVGLSRRRVQWRFIGPYGFLAIRFRGRMRVFRLFLRGH